MIKAKKLKNFFCLFLFLMIFFPCIFKAQVIETTREIEMSAENSTIKTRFKAPQGYRWETAPTESFEDFLINFPLKPATFPLRDYRNLPLAKQYHHAAILDIDVGEKDLQQCADAWMRLYGEYLWLHQRYDEIEFEFTSGQKMSWKDYKKGVRTTEDNDRVKFHKTAKYTDSYANFREYMDLVFRYAGTISLDRETVPVLKNSDIRVGDIIIKPGSPGHAVFIVGSARNSVGKRVFLLAESYMPAQDIHILQNPVNSRISPWYELDINAPKLMTAKYLFAPVPIKRFKSIK